MLKPIRTAAPSVRCITRDEVKNNLHIEHTDDDTLIDALILAAEAHLDGLSGSLNRCLMEQTWRFDALKFEHEHVGLEFPGAPSVVVKYLPPTGEAQVIPATEYHVLEDHFGAYIEFDPAFIAPDMRDQPGAAWVEVTSGAATPEELDADIKQAIILIVGHWYELRGVPQSPKEGIPFAAECLLATKRRSSV